MCVGCPEQPLADRPLLQTLIQTRATLSVGSPQNCKRIRSGISEDSNATLNGWITRVKIFDTSAPRLAADLKRINHGETFPCKIGVVEHFHRPNACTNIHEYIKHARRIFPTCEVSIYFRQIQFWQKNVSTSPLHIIIYK